MKKWIATVVNVPVSARTGSALIGSAAIGSAVTRFAVIGLAVIGFSVIGLVSSPTLTANLSAAGSAGPAEPQTIAPINPPGHFVPRTYSHVVKVGKLLFIAGQVGFDAEGKLVGPTMREQYEQTLKNLKLVLASQGVDFTQVAKITVFVTSIDEYRAPELQALRAKYVGDAKPASTLVQVVRLAEPDIKIEIEAIAAMP